MRKYNLVWWSGAIACLLALFVFPLLGPSFWFLILPCLVWFGIADIWTDRMIPEAVKGEMLLKKIVRGETN